MGNIIDAIADSLLCSRPAQAVVWEGARQRFMLYRGRIEADGGPLALIESQELGLVAVPHAEVTVCPTTERYPPAALDCAGFG